MAERFKIAIIGSGPGGISAAARAAERGESHVLLEAESHLSNTIYRYQKGKFVMDEPGILPLRSPVPFKAGSRESILGGWDEAAKKLKINVKFQHEVTSLKQGANGFDIKCANGQTVQADFVVLGIGLQGNSGHGSAPFENGLVSNARVRQTERGGSKLGTKGNGGIIRLKQEIPAFHVISFSLTPVFFPSFNAVDAADPRHLA